MEAKPTDAGATGGSGPPATFATKAARRVSVERGDKNYES
jgi:hypothetical protein